MNADELKLLAYQQRLSELTSEYEEKIANLRVELTLKQRDNDSLVIHLQDALRHIEELEAPKEDAVEEETDKRETEVDEVVEAQEA